MSTDINVNVQLNSVDEFEDKWRMIQSVRRWLFGFSGDDGRDD
jgi:hypothetical protein